MHGIHSKRDEYPEEKRFDIKVHHRDPKHGGITKITPYTLKIIDGQQRFLRNGIEYYPNGEPVNPALCLAKKQIEQNKIEAFQQNAFRGGDKQYMNPIMEEMMKVRDQVIGEITGLMGEVKKIIAALPVAPPPQPQAPAKGPAANKPPEAAKMPVEQNKAVLNPQPATQG